MTRAERREAYLQYLALKVEEQDWHGVADAAMDLRELEAELRTSKEQTDGQTETQRSHTDATPPGETRRARPRARR